ncbi:Hypothetical predicted protein [Pelobates cultripes]|uniref:Uncharacterized protein n=1 Tax=Pelobates cultripes TaxID=61616 RepID=A0AAD1RMC0_PELCU|nr:Hypothetical predicted protein [Pelobates cultripes]
MPHRRPLNPQRLGPWTNDPGDPGADSMAARPSDEDGTRRNLSPPMQGEQDWMMRTSSGPVTERPCIPCPIEVAGAGRDRRSDACTYRGTEGSGEVQGTLGERTLRGRRSTCRPRVLTKPGGGPGPGAMGDRVVMAAPSPVRVTWTLHMLLGPTGAIPGTTLIQPAKLHNFLIRTQ